MHAFDKIITGSAGCEYDRNGASDNSVQHFADGAVTARNYDCVVSVDYGFFCDITGISLLDSMSDNVFKLMIFQDIFYFAQNFKRFRRRKQDLQVQ